MDRLILGFVWFFGAVLVLSAAVQAARASIGGDIVWTVMVAVLILTLVVMGWVIRSIKQKVNPKSEKRKQITGNRAAMAFKTLSVCPKRSRVRRHWLRFYGAKRLGGADVDE